MQGAGYLAIWSDLTPQDQTDWTHWITREHAAERVGVNGFLACRIFRALGASEEYRLGIWQRKINFVDLCRFNRHTWGHT